jgi:hypothetical protein
LEGAVLGEDVNDPKSIVAEASTEVEDSKDPKSSSSLIAGMPDVAGDTLDATRLVDDSSGADCL